MPNLFPQPQTINANPMMQTPVVSIPSGFTNQGQNVQFVAIPAGHFPSFSYSEFSRGGGDFYRGSNGGLHLEQEGDAAGETLRDHKLRMMLIVWMLLPLTFSKTI